MRAYDDAHLLDILDTAPDAIIVIDASQRITLFNKLAEQLFAYPAREVLGQPLDVLIPRRFLETHGEAIPAVEPGPGAVRGTDERQEMIARRKDGDEFPAEVSMSRSTRDGQVTFTLIVRDITERKQAEAALRESEERFRQAFDYAAFGVALLTTDGDFLQVNPSLCKMFGYSGQELLEKSFQELTHPDDLELGLELFHAMKAGERDYGWLEKRYIHKDGRVIWALLSTSVVRDPRRAPLYLVSQIQDITERKQAETALRESEERYRALFDNSSDGILLTAPDGSILAANPAACRMLQRSEEEICRAGRSGLVDTSDPRLAPALEERARTGEFTGELFMLRRDGTRFPAEVSSNVFTDKDGQLRTSMIIRDVTERRQAEEMLIKLSSAIEQTADSVVITDRDGLIEYVNPAFEQVTGYTSQEAIGQTPRLLKSGKHAAEYYEQLWNTILAGDVFRAEMINRKKSGELYFEEKTITPIRDDQGVITHFVSTGKDVTRRKQDQEALRASVERAQLIMSATTDAVSDWDLGTGVVEWSHGLGTLFGYPDEGPRDHQWWHDRVHPEDILRIDEGVRAALNSGERFWTGEYRYRRADGSYAHVVDRRYVLYDEGSQPLRMIGAMVDVTERVRLAEAETRAAMEERQRLARELHDAVTQLLFSASLIAEVLPSLWDRDQAEGRAYLKDLHRLTRGALAEMRTLLLELRPSALTETSLGDLLRQLGDAVDGRTQTPVEVVVEVRGPLPPDVKIALYRVAQEALNNVVKHARASHVRVSMRDVHPATGTGGVELRIQDDGCGFDPTLASAEQLGLAIMRERAEAIGATLDIESEPGRGTQVVVLWRRPDAHES